MKYNHTLFADCKSPAAWQSTMDLKKKRINTVFAATMGLSVFVSRIVFVELSIKQSCCDSRSAACCMWFLLLPGVRSGPREIKYFLSDILITDRAAMQWLSPHLGKQKTWTRDVSSVRLIDNVEHLRHFTIVKLGSWTNNENENFVIAQMNQRTNSTLNKCKHF